MRCFSLFEESRSSWSVHTATGGSTRQGAATGRVSSVVSAENVATIKKLVGYFVIQCFSLFSQNFSPNVTQIGFCTPLAKPFVFTVWKTSGLAPQRKLVKFVNGYKHVGEVSQIFRRCLGTGCLQIVLYIIIYLPVWLDLHTVLWTVPVHLFPTRNSLQSTHEHCKRWGQQSVYCKIFVPDFRHAKHVRRHGADGLIVWRCFIGLVIAEACPAMILCRLWTLWPRSEKVPGRPR